MDPPLITKVRTLRLPGPPDHANYIPPAGDKGNQLTTRLKKIRKKSSQPIAWQPNKMRARNARPQADFVISSDAGGLLVKP